MSATRRVRIIVNPSARSGRARKALRQASRLAETQDALRLDWIESRSAEHLCELVQKSQDDALDGVAVGGGDGTVGLALGALEGLNRVPLGVLPLGSGNDFARDLGIPRRLSAALDVLALG